MLARDLPILSAALLLACPVYFSGCQRDEKPGDPSETSTVAHETEEHDALMALGYIAYAEDKPADPQRNGVVTRDPKRVDAGYSLYVTRANCIATLIDTQGNRVREWRGQPCGWWSNAELLPNGDLLVPASVGKGVRELGHRRLLRLSWEGDALWEKHLPVHHDVAQRSDGNSLALATRLRPYPGQGEDIKLADDLVVLLNDNGEVEDERSLYEILSDNEVGFEFKEWISRQGQPVDLFHTNSIEWLERPDLADLNPIYAPGNIVVTMRNQDSVLIINWEQRRLVWSYGQGVLSGPHNATVLENGNMLIFDNGRESKRSRVVEVNPMTRAIVWQYPPQGGREFFTDARGSAQRLPNGNTLIANSDSGEAYEVTSGGELVWEFANPVKNKKGHRATIVRMKRYPVEMVERLLDKEHAHTPGRTSGSRMIVP